MQNSEKERAIRGMNDYKKLLILLKYEQFTFNNQWLNFKGNLNKQN